MFGMLLFLPGVDSLYVNCTIIINSIIEKNVGSVIWNYKMAITKTSPINLRRKAANVTMTYIQKAIRFAGEPITTLLPPDVEGYVVSIVTPARAGAAKQVREHYEALGLLGPKPTKRRHRNRAPKCNKPAAERATPRQPKQRTETPKKAVK